MGVSSTLPMTVSFTFTKILFNNRDSHLLLQFSVFLLLQIKVSKYNVGHFLLAFIFVNKKNTAPTKLDHFNPEHMVDMGAMVVGFDIIIDHISVETQYFIVVLNHFQLPDDQAIVS